MHKIPKFDAPMVDEQKRCTRPWFLAFRSLFVADPEGAVAPTGSPFVYNATEPGSLLIVGGTVSAVTLQRNQTYATGLTSGFIPVSIGDKVTITYTVAPTLTFFPR